MMTQKSQRIILLLDYKLDIYIGYNKQNYPLKSGKGSVFEMRMHN